MIPPHVELAVLYRLRHSTDLNIETLVWLRDISWCDTTAAIRNLTGQRRAIENRITELLSQTS